MEKAQIGVIGMAVMGKNLALNIESKGYKVAVYDWDSTYTKKVMADHSDKNFIPNYEMGKFVESIEKPRKILMMVKAGAPTDSTIQNVLPYLEEGDVLIDGGNTFFKDTMRRNQELEHSGINFIGMGTSGGQKGALTGPSLMPGGQKEAYELVAPILKQIAAKAPEDDEPCVTYIGPNGAGHYVKMVHNGIEYGDMELIAESYDLMKQILKMSNQEIAAVFDQWRDSELNSYLIDITAEILTRKDDLETGKDIIDVILDSAGNKGTGKWSSQSALDLGMPQTLITEAVYARYISAMKNERVAASKVLSAPQIDLGGLNKDQVIEQIRKSLYFSKIMSYAQGFEQIKVASDNYHWDIKLGDLAKIWRAGCIIRAQFLQKITDAYEKNPKLDNLLLDDYFKEVVGGYQNDVREIVLLAVKAGIPCPCFTSAVTYYDQYRAKRLPANLIQAQRDYFGAHTYERTDREGNYHYEWYPEE